MSRHSRARRCRMQATRSEALACARRKREAHGRCARMAQCRGESGREGEGEVEVKWKWKAAAEAEAEGRTEERAPRLVDHVEAHAAGRLVDVRVVDLVDEACSTPSTGLLLITRTQLIPSVIVISSLPLRVHLGDHMTVHRPLRLPSPFTTAYITELSSITCEWREAEREGKGEAEIEILRDPE